MIDFIEEVALHRDHLHQETRKQGYLHPSEKAPLGLLPRERANGLQWALDTECKWPAKTKKYSHPLCLSDYMSNKFNTARKSYRMRGKTSRYKWWSSCLKSSICSHVSKHSQSLLHIQKIRRSTSSKERSMSYNRKSTTSRRLHTRSLTWLAWGHPSMRGGQSMRKSFMVIQLRINHFLRIGKAESKLNRSSEGQKGVLP